MYDKADPRSALASSSASKLHAGAMADAQLGLFYKDPPQDEQSNFKTWYARGQNMLIAYTQAEAGAVLERKNQKDEYFVLVPDHNTPVTVSSGGQTEHVDGYHIIIMPPGDGRVTVEKGGRIIRIFSTQSDDLNAKCVNADQFTVAQPNIPPFQYWPAPHGGFKIRCYTLDVPDEPGRFGRSWRCSSVMVNYLAPQQGPRDVTKLSPHFHDDFEQCSLALDGSFVHHLRWPWTINMNEWKEDLHAHVHSPSITIIPPPAIHTSRGMEQGLNQLVDIFAPPRMDFSLKAGWILNAQDYPLPSA